MKRIILFLTIVVVALQLSAQLVYDESGEIIPFSIAEGYKEKIEAYKVPFYIIPFMNNDSLCRKYNKGKTFSELEDFFCPGFDIRNEPISLKEKGVCIKLEHGKLWRYSIEGVSVGGIGFELGFPKLPKGTYIAVFAPDSTLLIQPPTILHSGNLLEGHKNVGIGSSVDGKKLILEYFEPDSLKEKEDIFIKSIIYIFTTFYGKEPSTGYSPGLKSGFYGNSEFSACQKDVACTDNGNYLNEAKSVVLNKQKTIRS